MRRKSATGAEKFPELSQLKLLSVGLFIGIHIHTGEQFHFGNKMAGDGAGHPEEDKDKQKGFIKLLMITKKALEECIDILGFTAPDRM